MFQVTNFCGASGQSYHFKKVSMEQADWLGQPGLAIYATADGRVIRVAEQVGRPEDMGAIWRLREARRYGAALAYFRPHRDVMARTAEVKDLVRGLSPLFDCGPTSGDYLARHNAEELPVAA